MAVLAAMRQREARRIGEAVRRAVDDLGHHRQRTHGARADARHQQQLGEIGRAAVGRGGEIAVQAAQIDVRRRGHRDGAGMIEMRQRELPLRAGPRRLRGIERSANSRGDAVRPERLQQVELAAARRSARWSVRLTISPCPVPSIAACGSSTKLVSPSESQ